MAAEQPRNLSAQLEQRLAEYLAAHAHTETAPKPHEIIRAIADLECRMRGFATPLSRPAADEEGDEPGAVDIGVGARLKPKPTLNCSGIALPLPEEPELAEASSRYSLVL
jgi:hypothetical protein